MLLLERLAPALRSGLPPAAAAEVVGQHHASAETRELMDTLVRSARHGAGWSDAWRRAAERHGCTELHLVAAATRLSERLGSPLADAMTAAAASIRAAQRREAAAASASAAARATVNLLSVLPVGGLALGAALGLSPTTMYGSPLGAACGVLAVFLTVGGRWVTARMVRRVVTGHV